LYVNCSTVDTEYIWHSCATSVLKGREKKVAILYQLNFFEPNSFFFWNDRSTCFHLWENNEESMFCQIWWFSVFFPFRFYQIFNVMFFSFSYFIAAKMKLPETGLRIRLWSSTVCFSFAFRLIITISAAKWFRTYLASAELRNSFAMWLWLLLTEHINN